MWALGTETGPSVKAKVILTFEPSPGPLFNLLLYKSAQGCYDPKDFSYILVVVAVFIWNILNAQRTP